MCVHVCVCVCVCVCARVCGAALGKVGVYYMRNQTQMTVHYFTLKLVVCLS